MTEGAPSSNTNDSLHTDEDLLEATLYRLTKGLPPKELRHMLEECDECETALQEDIRWLEQALGSSSTEGSTQQTEAVEAMLLASPWTPLDRYWTASALLGRLRNGGAAPSSHTSTSTTAESSHTPAGQDAAEALNRLASHPRYVQECDAAVLLVTWKKISTHKSALVFKKPVKDEDAPGYKDRILFPMDLSLLRKFIVTRHVKSYAKLHDYIALISHNCVKYNGRHSDYGQAAREFEAAADEIIRQAVVTKVSPSSATLPKPDGSDSNVLTVEASASHVRTGPDLPEANPSNEKGESSMTVEES